MKRALWLIIAVASLAALSNPASAQSTPSPSGQKATDVTNRQARSVKDQVLTSQEMPAVRIEFDNGFKYAGSHSFVLYEVAHAEQHFFVDADKEGRVKRMYWVQFEGYLPGNTHTYRYKVNKTANIGGLEFIADAYARNIKANPGRPDSDGARAPRIFGGQGLPHGER